jgi:hypothetical protein
MAAKKRGVAKRYVARRAAKPETVVVEIRRKNLELDQRRIDQVKEALGARTETEAITLAMDVALEMSDFRVEVAKGSAKLFGRGGFVNRFDDEASLDFSGFQGRSATSPSRAHRPRLGGQS